MKKYFSISGYWKDDRTEFSGYVVTNFDDCDEDDDIFFYGLEEEEIQQSLNDEDTALDFVITSYQIIS